jgi:hypothetical protein
MQVKTPAMSAGSAVCAAELRPGDRIVRAGSVDARTEMLIDTVDMRAEADHWLLIVSGRVPAGYDDTWLMPLESTVWRLAAAGGPARRARRQPLAGVAAAALATLGIGCLWTSTQRRREEGPVAESSDPVESISG